MHGVGGSLLRSLSTLSVLSQWGVGGCDTACVRRCTHTHTGAARYKHTTSTARRACTLHMHFTCTCPPLGLDSGDRLDCLLPLAPIGLDVDPDPHRETRAALASEAAICPTSKTRTCRSAGRSTCCNWRPPRGSPSTFTMRSPTAIRPQASAGPPGFKIVTRLTLSRPRPRPEAQPSTVISYACMHVRGGTGGSGGRRPRGAASLHPGREGRKWIVTHLGFLLHTQPGLVNRLEVGGVAVCAPQAGARVPNLTWQRRAHLLLVMIDPCGEQTQTWALAQKSASQRLRTVCVRIGDLGAHAHAPKVGVEERRHQVRHASRRKSQRLYPRGPRRRHEFPEQRAFVRQLAQLRGLPPPELAKLRYIRLPGKATCKRRAARPGKIPRQTCVRDACAGRLSPTGKLVAASPSPTRKLELNPAQWQRRSPSSSRRPPAATPSRAPSSS